MTKKSSHQELFLACYRQLSKHTNFQPTIPPLVFGYNSSLFAKPVPFAPFFIKKPLFCLYQQSVGNEIAIVRREIAIVSRANATVGNEIATVGSEIALVGNENTLVGNEIISLGSEIPSTGNEIVTVGNENASRGNETATVGSEIPSGGNAIASVARENGIVSQTNTNINHATHIALGSFSALLSRSALGCGAYYLLASFYIRPCNEQERTG